MKNCAGMLGKVREEVQEADGVRHLAWVRVSAHCAYEAQCRSRRLQKSARLCERVHERYRIG